MRDDLVKVSKDAENERPVPTVWRASFSSIIAALVKRDYLLSASISGVAKVSESSAAQIQDYLDDYGEELILLPDATWETSVCMWMDGYWEVLIDLWTKEAGRSDLVLGARVYEEPGGYIINIDMVYVP